MVWGLLPNMIVSRFSCEVWSLVSTLLLNGVVHICTCVTAFVCSLFTGGMQVLWCEPLTNHLRLLVMAFNQWSYPLLDILTCLFCLFYLLQCGNLYQLWYVQLMFSEISRIRFPWIVVCTKFSLSMQVSDNWSNVL